MMTREAVDKWIEWSITGLVTLALVFAPLALGAVQPRAQLILAAMAVATLVLWVVRLWVGAGYRVLWPPLAWGVLLVLGYAIVRYRYSPIEYVARLELLQVIVYCVFFFVIVTNVYRQETSQMVVFALLFIAMAISMYAIYQFITNSDRVWTFPKPPQYMKRASGTYICPNHLAGFLELLAPLGLAYTILGRFKPTAKVLLAYVSLAILSGIAVTLSRGGWFATGCSLLLFFGLLLRYREYRLQALIGLVLVAALGAAFLLRIPYTKSRFQQLFAEEKTEENFRFLLWPPALEIWKENPWWGGGLGHFDYRFRQHRPAIVQWRPEYAHNDYLNTLADWGLAGLLAIGICGGIAAVGVVKTAKFVTRSPRDLSMRKSNKAALHLGAACGLAAILIHSLIDFNLHLPANALVTVALLAWLSTQWRYATDRFWVSNRWFLRTLLSALALGAGAYLILQGRQLAAQDYWLRKADDPKNSVEIRLRALEQAIAAEPHNYLTAYRMGELLRRQSWEGHEGYATLAETALGWFRRSAALNPFDSYSFLRIGMCLHWLGRPAEADPAFRKAIELDPKSYYLAAHMGWHYFQLEQLDRAKEWFDFSLRLKPYYNRMPVVFLEIIKRRQAEPKP